MTGRQRIVGNWKMHGDAARLAAFVRARAALRHPHRDVLLAVPATLIDRAAAALPGIAIGGQDCHAAAAGAFTGDVAAAMIADAGGRFILLGHSERRLGHGERDEDVRDKAAAALQAGLEAIVCVGEAHRDAATARTQVAESVIASLPDAVAGRLTIAYEPVWAIGSGETPSRDHIAEIATVVRDAAAASRWGRAPMEMLYGGSVDGDNAAAILALEGVNGLLVGNASLSPERFAAVVHSQETALPSD